MGFSDSFHPITSIFSNLYFLGVLIVSVAIQYFMVEYGGDYVQTSPLSPDQWSICFLLALPTLLIDLLSRSTTSLLLLSKPTSKELNGLHENKEKGWLSRKIVLVSLFVGLAAVLFLVPSQTILEHVPVPPSQKEQFHRFLHLDFFRNSKFKPRPW